MTGIAEKDRLQEQGFAVLRGVFSAQDIAETAALLSDLVANFDHLTGVRARDHGGAEGQKVQPEIDRPTRLMPTLFETQVYKKARAAASHLLGGQARHTFNHIICKMPQGEIETPWHQDQAYLGPYIRLNTVNFWIPMQDVDAENGTMVFLPGSQKQGLQPHGRTDTHHPHIRKAPVLAGGGDSEDKAVVCTLKAGDCTVHHPLTLHYALGNRSKAPRMAWALHFNRFGRLSYFAPHNIIGTLMHRLQTGKHVAA